MARVTDRGKAKFIFDIGPLRRTFTLDNSSLVRIVAGRAGDPSPRHDRHGDPEVLFGAVHVVKDPCGGFNEKVGLEKGVRHGRMTAPAQKSDIGPEFHIVRIVQGRVGHLRMAQEADRFAVDLPEPMLIVQHQVRIDESVLFLRMTAKTDFPPVLVGAAVQQFFGPFVSRSAVDLVAGQARNLAIEKRERYAGVALRFKINGMMVFLVVVTGQAGRRRV